MLHLLLVLPRLPLHPPPLLLLPPFLLSVQP